MEKLIKKVSEKITIVNIKQIIKMLKLIIVDTFVNIILIIIIVPLLYIGQFFTHLKDS